MSVKVFNLYLKQSILLFFYIFYTNGIKRRGLIYILEWTSANIEPFNYLGKGQYPFVSRNCSYQNCYLTNDSDLFDSVLDFDVLLFNVVNLYREETTLPSKRSAAQEYVLVGLEPSGYYPISSIYNGFFNLTWTYKLQSDVPYPYLLIKNKHGRTIGPRKEVKWINFKSMAPTDHSIVRKLGNKTIAAAWFVSNCDGISGRHTYALSLNKELKKYGHQIDIYGKCGTMQCPMAMETDECTPTIDSDYYFYLAFENSIGEDYVTEKLLHGLKHYTVPIVLGGANYTRFMPDGIYLNALSYQVEQLAREISAIIKDRPRYFDFFKWHRYYSFHSSKECYDCVCGICAVLNKRRVRNETSVYRDITGWWNERQSRGSLPGSQNIKEFMKSQDPVSREDEPPSKDRAGHFMKLMSVIVGFGVLSLFSVALFIL